MEYENWALGKGNLLDMNFESHLAIPSILEQFASQCIEAAQQHLKYCSLAERSLNATDPMDHLSRRIDTIFKDLSIQAYYDRKNDQVQSLYYALDMTRHLLMAPSRYPSLARVYDYLESSIQNSRTVGNQKGKSRIRNPTSNTNITTNGHPPEDPLIGDSNAFVNPAVMCLDGNMHGIENSTSFTNYISSQIDQNIIVGGLGISTAICLGWPNLEAYDVERVQSPFPAKLRNKVLVIGVTGDPVTPYAEALNLYNFLGSENANFLVHDAMGHCSVSHPNNCTKGAIKEFFVTGIAIEMKLY